MACNDDRGRKLLIACRDAAVQVPDEVAVVGADNDELVCELGDPPLSSVALNLEVAGYTWPSPCSPGPAGGASIRSARAVFSIMHSRSRLQTASSASGAVPPSEMANRSTRAAASFAGCAAR